MPLHQIPDITQDDGFREEAERFVEQRQNKYADIYVCLKNAARDAFMRGLLSGFQCGYRIGYLKAEKDLSHS